MPKAMRVTSKMAINSVLVSDSRPRSRSVKGRAVIDGLVAQIQETMTAQQMQAITAMNLTRQDMFSILQTQGGGTGNNPQFGNTQNGNSSGNRNRNFGGGGFVPGAGGPPADGGGFGGGQGFGGQNRSASQIATAQAARQTRAGNRIPAPLINAVIELLKKKSG